MKEDLVNIYEAASLLIAQLINARLEDANIRSFIDQDNSPLDGLTAADQMIIVRVHPDDTQRAVEIIKQFEAEKADDQSAPDSNEV